MTAFGADSFGTSGLPVSVTGLEVLTLDSVRLALTVGSELGIRNPRRIDSIWYYANWYLDAVSPLDAVARLVRSVQLVDGYLVLYFDGRLQPGARYRLYSALLSFEFSFTSLQVAATDLGSRRREMIIQDWAKPESSRDLQGGSLGTVQISAGDMALTSGAASLRERIIRLVQTTAGGFVHDGSYGMEPWEKRLLTVDSLQRMQSRLVAQIRRDPDVVRVSVKVGQAPDASNVVSVAISADTVDGPLVVATEVGRK